jgi:hypothetical protein
MGFQLSMGAVEAPEGGIDLGASGASATDPESEISAFPRKRE